MVVIVRGGEVVHRKGYGLADLAAGKPVTRETRFLLGSLTKPFTALTVMQLAERGQLGLEDPIRRFLPEFSPYGDSLTIRHLLGHTGGLPEYEGMFVTRGQVDSRWPRSVRTPRSTYEPTAKDATALLAREARPAFPPGSKYQYSNSGYVLLAQIVERVSGLRFADYLQRNVFEPAGMTASLLYDERRPDVPERSLSYSRADTGYAEIDYTPFDAIYGEDNIYATADDVARWFQALRAGRLINQASLLTSWTRGVTTAGDTVDYGLGWSIGSLLGRKQIGHGGSWRGFRSQLFHLPGDDLTVILLANFAEFLGSWVAAEIAWVYLGDRLPAPVEITLPRDRIEGLVGRYRVRRYTLELQAAGAQLSLGSAVLPRAAVALSSDSTGFIRRNPGVGLRFERDGRGRATALTLILPGGRLRIPRVE